MLEKKIIRKIRRKEEIRQDPLTSAERYLQSKTTFGIGIILIGLLCPFFWMRFFAGDYGSETVVYGFYYVLFIGKGLILFGKGQYDLNR